MDNLTYWQTRTLRTQERLAKKTESDVNCWYSIFVNPQSGLSKILMRYMTKSRQ